MSVLTLDDISVVKFKLGTFNNLYRERPDIKFSKGNGREWGEVEGGFGPV